MDVSWLQSCVTAHLFIDDCAINLPELPLLRSFSAIGMRGMEDDYSRHDSSLEDLRATLTRIRWTRLRDIRINIPDHLSSYLMSKNYLALCQKLEQIALDVHSHVRDVAVNIPSPLSEDRTGPWRSACAAFQARFPVLHQRGLLKLQGQSKQPRYIILGVMFDAPYS